jgi:hypothetical protein
VLNVRERVNPSGNPAFGTQFGVVGTDQIHPSDTGHALLADFMLAV